MDGITTMATRQITREVFQQYGKPGDTLKLWTEFMNVDGFLINPAKVAEHLETTPEQQPIAQIFWGTEETLIKAAVSIEHTYGNLFSGIELNTGCPSNAVMKCGWWSELMKNKKKTLTIIKHLSASLQRLPFSIKARAGLNDEDLPAQQEFLIEASQYCSSISIHGRTLKQLYGGEANWKFIQQTKQRLLNPACLVFWNGGIASYDQAIEYQERYGLDGVMIGQAAIGNPWIFTLHQPSNAEKLEVILKHLELHLTPSSRMHFSGEEEKADRLRHRLVEFRKFLFAYVKGIPGSREWKNSLLSISDYDQMKAEICKFL